MKNKPETTMLLTKYQIKQMRKFTKVFPKREYFYLHQTNESGIGPSIEISVCSRTDSKDITDVSNW